MPYQVVGLLTGWMGGLQNIRVMIIGRLSHWVLCGPFGESKIEELLKALNNLQNKDASPTFFV